MSDVEKLLQALRIVSEQMTEETIKEATNEQLLEYTVLNFLKTFFHCILCNII